MNDEMIKATEEYCGLFNLDFDEVVRAMDVLLDTKRFSAKVFKIIMRSTPTTRRRRHANQCHRNIASLPTAADYCLSASPDATGYFNAKIGMPLREMLSS